MRDVLYVTVFAYGFVCLLWAADWFVGWWNR